MKLADNRVVSVVDQYRAQLAPRYPEGEVRAILRSVFQERMGWDAAQLEVKRFESMSESELLKVYLPLKRLVAGEPLQYVLGEVHFHGLRLQVDKRVLIPRPETEEMVDGIVRSGIVPSRIADIGTGSGCIALALKNSFPRADVVATDSDQGALLVAMTNGMKTGIEVHWELCDALEEGFPLGSFDLVVSNPPYVPVGFTDSLAAEVLDHEPHLALFVPDDEPLCFFHAIGTWALRSLRRGGSLWFETHHDQARPVSEVLLGFGFAKADVLLDLSGKERFVHAVR
ncbi:MAG: peptide chain release factor N(5)-glutamine methyltransferase [Flavobacteriales bacterium]|nr:peptide chain release factor N(5)-glutamine methyltransferase [Flavobacteriales bacterium]MBP6699202.1 peptide chain release factor N(5)-glutamine methyltransferase [Flavobacteriales bacterium]